jgi:SAM-dependent methyltransferase
MIIKIVGGYDIMGGRRKTRGPGGGGRKGRFGDPLDDTLGGNESMTPDSLFLLVRKYCTEKTNQIERLKKAEGAIFDIYTRFTPAQRTDFFSRLYDRFSERYDVHMGIETNHYRAIRRVLQYAMPYLRPPMLDITAGTGEPLKYAIEFIDAVRSISAPFELLKPYERRAHLNLVKFLANEISPKMSEKSKEKLKGMGVDFSGFDAHALPPDLKGRFKTVLCSQTFHLIAEEDKTRLSKSIYDTLSPGGVAVVMEEDPFKISDTMSIEAVSLFLRSVAVPIKHHGTLLGYFANSGFQIIEETASAAIDEHHVMRLHLFLKPGQS